MLKVVIAVPTYENISPETFKSIYELDKSDLITSFIYVTGYDCAYKHGYHMGDASIDGYLIRS